MKGMNRRQATAGLLLAMVSAVSTAGQQRPRGGGGQQQRPPGAGQQQRPAGASQQRRQDPQQGRKEMATERKLGQGRMRDDDIYGSEMMTAEERERYRTRLNKAQTDREWAQIRAEHQAEIQQRAKLAGKPIDPPVYGQHMMSAEERARYTKRLQDAAGAAEREQIQNEHREFIRNRARELGMATPPVPRN
jgi:preprotein translocase subunit SecD